MGAVASTQPGMGAIPYRGGVAFRVWAKFAGAVFVAGQFNAWSTSATPLAPEGDGYWSVDVPGARTGQQYKYYIPSAPPDGWRVDPYARSISQPNLNGIITPAAAAYTTPGYSTPAWNDLVIYELHIESFLFDPASYNGMGSFTSAASKLRYLAGLGVNAIEIMPLGQFLGDFSTGYNPCYIFAVENEWGGPDAFRELVNQAHRLGIAVILDVVYNHVGPSAAGMWVFDGWSQSGACPFDGYSTAGGIYFYNDYRAHTNYAHTRFDYGRPEVRQYIRDNALMWLRQRFVDGLRFDSVGAIRNVLDQNDDPAHDLPDGWSLLQWINDEIRRSQPWKITIAEDLKDNEWITKPTGAGGAGFGAQWGAGFLNVVRNALMTGDDAQRDLHGVRDMILQRYNGDSFQRVICTETHDAAAGTWGAGRVPHQIWPDRPDSWASKKRSTLGAALVFTAPGIPMIFMGQEFLEWTAFDGATQLDWSKSTAYAGITNLYRDLIRLRRNGFNTTRGLRGQGVEACPLNGLDRVLVFHRWDRGGPGDDVVVVCNFANCGFTNYAIGFPRAGRWRVRFNSDWRGYSDDFGNWFAYDTDADGPPLNGMPGSGNVGIGPYTCIILSQD